MTLPTTWRSTDPWTKAVLGFLVSLLLLLILTLFGWMETIPTALALLPVTFSSLAALHQLFQTKAWLTLAVIVILALVAWVNLAGEAPSIFSGRDQGSIATAAWLLAKNGSLYEQSPVVSAFFNIYGEGPALNFPGFAYTALGSLTTQFPLAYTAWLAGMIPWFGLTGYAFGNSFLSLLGGWTMFTLLLRFVRPTLALVGTAFMTLTFLPVWLMSLTLTENLALVLFLVLALAILRLYAAPNPWSYVIALLAASLFLFTRIEGWVLAPLAAILILGHRTTRQWVLSKKGLALILPTLALLFIGLRDFFVNLPFYKMIGKAVIKNWHEVIAFGSQAASTTGGSDGLTSLFTAYGLWPVCIAGAVGIAVVLYRQERRFLPVLALALPTFVYFIDAHITPDHPWMLRRYYFSLWPTLIFFAIILWHYGEQRHAWLRSMRATSFIIIVLGVLHLPAAQTAWRLDEHTSLLETTEQIADRISGHDLILVDRESSGDPYRLVAGPLESIYGKQAVYHFNPQDLERLPLDQFERTFLLVPTTAVEILVTRYGSHLIPKETFDFTIPRVAIEQAWYPSILSTPTQATLLQYQP